MKIALCGGLSYLALVAAVNHPPVIGPLPDVILDKETTVILEAWDEDHPPNCLTYEVLDAPPGAEIDWNRGQVTWCPSATQIPAIWKFTFRVTDDGTPALSDTRSMRVSVPRGGILFEQNDGCGCHLLRVGAEVEYATGSDRDIMFEIGQTVAIREHDLAVVDHGYGGSRGVSLP